MQQLKTAQGFNLFGLLSGWLDYFILCYFMFFILFYFAAGSLVLGLVWSYKWQA